MNNLLLQHTHTLTLTHRSGTEECSPPRINTSAHSQWWDFPTPAHMLSYVFCQSHRAAYQAERQLREHSQKLSGSAKLWRSCSRLLSWITAQLMWGQLGILMFVQRCVKGTHTHTHRRTCKYMFYYF